MLPTNTPFLDFWCANSRKVKLNLNFVEVQNLNRIFWFEIYTHSNGHSVPQNAIAELRVPGIIFVSFTAHNRWCGWVSF